MKITCKTGETVYSLHQYYRTNHWNTLISNYIESSLLDHCFKCKSHAIPSNFLHRTKKRIGNERLTDLLPVCSNCIDAKPNPSKKKSERRSLSPFAFNPNKLSEDKKQWMLSIEPRLRGYVLSRYFSKQTISYQASSYWVNAQVKKACKWIKETESQMSNRMNEEL